MLKTVLSVVLFFVNFEKNRLNHKFNDIPKKRITIILVDTDYLEAALRKGSFV